MSQLLADLRYTLRTLRRVPLFTTVAVLSMAFGIAANTAVFTLLDQVILRKLPVSHPAELVQVDARGMENFSGGMGDGTELSFPMYRDLRDENTVFAGMFCRAQTSLHVGHNGRTEQVAGELVSGSFFPVLGVQPAIGRLFTADDDRTPGGHPVAVLGFAHWRSRFNGDPAIVGRSITVNGQSLEVIGVVQQGFEGLDIGQPVQLYVPVSMQPKMGPAWLQLEGRRFRWVQVYARLRNSMTPETAQAGIQPLYRALLQRESTDAAFAEAAPDTKRRFLEGALTVTDASRGHSSLRNYVSEPLGILMALAGGVLLIVCANVSNLLIARGAGRHRELALRLAIGAARRQIVRLLLVESLVLAALGAVVGLILASWGADVLLGYFVTPDTPRAVTATPDGRVLLFTCALTVLTALLAGILPALRSTRVDVAPALKGSGGAVVREEPRLRKTLVVAQVALSFTLLVAAGLFLRSLNNLMNVDPGFRTSQMLTFGFDLSRSGYDRARAAAFATTFLERISRVPGAASVAFTFQTLLGNGGWGMELTVEGYQAPPGDSAGAALNAVSPGYFTTMGIPLLAGREFDAHDDHATAIPEGWPYRVAVVNEAFAKRYFKDANPIGRRIGIGSNPGTRTPIEIVGLVKDTKYRRDPGRAGGTGVLPVSAKHDRGPEHVRPHDRGSPGRDAGNPARDGGARPAARHLRRQHARGASAALGRERDHDCEPVGHAWRHGDAAVRHRALRGDGTHGHAADARDRHPHGPWRTRPAHCRCPAARGRRAHRHRSRRRAHGGLVAWAVRAESAVRRRACGYGNHRARGRCPDDGRGDRVATARDARRAPDADVGTARRLVACPESLILESLNR